MNTELQNAIRLAMCRGWIKTIAKPSHMPEINRIRSLSRSGITISNCSVVNCGTAIHIEGGNLMIDSSHIENCETAIAASGDAVIDASYMSINYCETVFKELD